MQDVSEKSAASSRVKIVSTVLIFSAVILWVGHAVVAFPTFLESMFSVTQVVLLIHAVEGAIAAILIFLYRQRLKANPESNLSEQPKSLLTEHLPNNTPLAIVKGSLYTFFVGTVGLLEIIKAYRSL